MSEGRDETNSNQPNTRPSANPTGFQVAIDSMLENKIDTLLWLTRLGTIFFTIICMIPIFGNNSYTSYKQALMTNAATSALRLHQRMPRVQFTREFGAMLLLEDSCHYLLYSLLFIYSYPITLSLLPIFFFAVLHSAHYSIHILNKLGLSDNALTSLMYYIAGHMQRKIFRIVSLTEVTLMPLTIFMTMGGKGSLITPFAYYRFLTFRYASRRNPYTRTLFREIRMILENIGNTPGRNPQIRNMCYKVINFVSYFAPPIPAQQ